MKFLKKIILIKLFLLLFLVNYTNAEEGVSNNAINIGLSGPQTGPAAPWGLVNKGIEFCFKMVNFRGGIHGRKLFSYNINDRYNSARTKAGVKYFQENIGIFAWLGIIGSETALSVSDYLNNKRIPWIGPIDASSIWNNPPRKYRFTLYPCFSYETSAYCRYAIKYRGKNRLAIIYMDDG
jgi:branched-chain amino acid transport system substrate-binding protein